MVLYCFVDDFRGKIDNRPRKDEKIYVFLAFENFNLIMYNILNHKFISSKKSDLKQRDTVIRLMKPFEDF